MKYIVPEYYKQFNCKCGECRHSCCEGWPIRISRKEYYRLLGINCSDKLRAKLDCGLKICHEPSIEYYAEISTDWRGTCTLHREDGLCALQTELGEAALPDVCRLYPRKSNQLINNCECSCSNSCEMVVELLMIFKEPLGFEEISLSMNPEFKINLPPAKYECCIKSISMIQNRSLSLAERFIDLGNFLNGTNFNAKRPDNLTFAFQVLHIFNTYFESRISISDYCKASQSYYCTEGIEYLTEEDLLIMNEKYRSASDHLESILPDWQIHFEQLIVNHMFYNNFPYIDNREKTEDAFLSLAAVYSFLRFHILGYMFDKTSMEDLVDVLAAMFRVIEHSNFKHDVVHLLKKVKHPVPDCMIQLIYL